MALSLFLSRYASIATRKLYCIEPAARRVRVPHSSRVDSPVPTQSNMRTYATSTDSIEITMNML